MSIPLWTGLTDEFAKLSLGDDPTNPPKFIPISKQSSGHLRHANTPPEQELANKMFSTGIAGANDYTGDSYILSLITLMLKNCSAITAIAPTTSRYGYVIRITFTMADYNALKTKSGLAYDYLQKSISNLDRIKNPDGTVNVAIKMVFCSDGGPGYYIARRMKPRVSLQNFLNECELSERIGEEGLGPIIVGKALCKRDVNDSDIGYLMSFFKTADFMSYMEHKFDIPSTTHKLEKAEGVLQQAEDAASTDDPTKITWKEFALRKTRITPTPQKAFENAQKARNVLGEQMDELQTAERNRLKQKKIIAGIAEDINEELSKLDHHTGNRMTEVGFLVMDDLIAKEYSNTLDYSHRADRADILCAQIRLLQAGVLNLDGNPSNVFVKYTPLRGMAPTPMPFVNNSVPPPSIRFIDMGMAVDLRRILKEPGDIASLIRCVSPTGDEGQLLKYDAIFGKSILDPTTITSVLESLATPSITYVPNKFDLFIMMKLEVLARYVFFKRPDSWLANSVIGNYITKHPMNWTNINVSIHDSFMSETIDLYKKEYADKRSLKEKASDLLYSGYNKGLGGLSSGLSSTLSTGSSVLSTGFDVVSSPFRYLGRAAYANTIGRFSKQPGTDVTGANLQNPQKTPRARSPDSLKLGSGGKRRTARRCKNNRKNTYKNNRKRRQQSRSKVRSTRRRGVQRH